MSNPKERFPHNYDGKNLSGWHDCINVSYIISVYNRPWFLKCVLASLSCQSDINFEAIVTDNSDLKHCRDENKAIVDGFDSRFSYRNIGEKTCYHSAAIGAKDASGRYLCFPSDDSYYTPMFQECMVKMADENNLGFIYSGILYNPFYPDKNYAVYPSEAKLFHIDKTQYLIRKELFDGFAHKDGDHPGWSDGLIIQDLVNKGVKHAKHESVLVVHN